MKILLLVVSVFYFSTYYSLHESGIKYKELVSFVSDEINIVDIGYSDSLKTKLIEIYSPFKGVNFITEKDLEKEKFINPKSDMLIWELNVRMSVSKELNTVIDYSSDYEIRISRIGNSGSVIISLPKWFQSKDKDENVFLNQVEAKKPMLEAGIIQTSKVLKSTIQYSLENKQNLDFVKYFKASEKALNDKLRGKTNIVFVIRDIEKSEYRFKADNDLLSKLTIINDGDYKALMFSDEDKIVSYTFDAYKGDRKLLVNNTTGEVLFYA